MKQCSCRRTECFNLNYDMQSVVLKKAVLRVQMTIICKGQTEQPAGGDGCKKGYSEEREIYCFDHTENNL